MNPYNSHYNAYHNRGRGGFDQGNFNINQWNPHLYPVPQYNQQQYGQYNQYGQGEYARQMQMMRGQPRTRPAQP